MCFELMKARTIAPEFMKFNDRLKRNTVRVTQILPGIFTTPVSVRYYRSEKTRRIETHAYN